MTPGPVLPGKAYPQAERKAEAEEERNARTQVFEKTKMCKFYILGACTKGSTCRFAHYPSELQGLPDLACTKLCKTLVAMGKCDNPECRYAHNREELRPIPFDTKDDESSKPASADDASTIASQGDSAKAMYASQAMQSALLQHLGQAAQAHAAEAARLQAAAAQLQSLQKASSDAGDSPWSYGGYAETQAPSYDDMLQLGAGAATMAPTREEPKLVVKNTFLEYDDFRTPSGPIKPLRSVASAAGRLCSMGEETPRSEGMGPAMTRALAEEPVQINLSSLRSLSSNSLVTLGEESDNDWMGGPPAGHRGLHHSRQQSRAPTCQELSSLQEESGFARQESDFPEDAPLPVPAKASPMVRPLPEPPKGPAEDWLGTAVSASDAFSYSCMDPAKWVEMGTGYSTDYGDSWSLGTCGAFPAVNMTYMDSMEQVAVGSFAESHHA
eukprot:TRINITY_DN89853_c0_g1_i1.p1 TRINITY_DN89853_c0_g1~~TRINITY_DN89853_c0_g1_i1.p1  ORF type:complete len:482 (-),score=99.82 TRINITY_DN89853_c0_g1_i1:164-1486(-)